MAMKMSSPKNTPMLSVAAAWARIRYARPLGDSTETILGRGLAHRRDQRANHLGMTAERRQSESGRQLADREIREEQAPGRRDREPRDERPRLFLEAVPLEHSDHGKREPDDRHRTAVDEGLAESGDHLDDRLVRGQPRRDRRDGHDENRVRAKREPGDDDENADEWKQAAVGRRRLNLRADLPLRDALHLLERVPLRAQHRDYALRSDEVARADDDERVVTAPNERLDLGYPRAIARRDQRVEQRRSLAPRAS